MRISMKCCRGLVNSKMCHRTRWNCSGCMHYGTESKTVPGQIVQTASLSQVSRTKALGLIASAVKAVGQKIPSIDFKNIVEKIGSVQGKVKSEDPKWGEDQVKNVKVEVKKQGDVNEETPSTFQYVVSSLWRAKEKDEQSTIPKWKLRAKPVVSKESIDARTRHLVHCLLGAKKDDAMLVHLEEFCQHLFIYPHAKWIAAREQVIPRLLRIRSQSKDELVQSHVREALSLVGYLEPPDAPGLRILSLDGGGTRGILIIRILERIEQLTGRPIHKNFDYICGVSTGAILAILLGIHKKSLAECDHLYRNLSLQVFSRSRSDAISSLVRSHAYYDTSLWEKALQDSVGFEPMIKCSRDRHFPKVGVVSSVVNQEKAFPYIFRNYTLPLRNQSRYHGSCRHRSWEAARASSAAPGYFGEFALEDNIHQDGGLLTNNPTSIAIHEAKNLWPQARIHCVVSIGTGRNQPLSSMEGTDPTMTSLRQKLVKVIDSATDTERVHNILHDLLPPRSYFRFNPYLSQVYGLDEINSYRLDAMLRDVDMYLRKNETKLGKSCERLLDQRRLYQRALDWVEVQRLMYQPEFLRGY